MIDSSNKKSLTVLCTIEQQCVLTNKKELPVSILDLKLYFVFISSSFLCIFLFSFLHSVTNFFTTSLPNTSSSVHGKATEDNFACLLSFIPFIFPSPRWSNPRRVKDRKYNDLS